MTQAYRMVYVIGLEDVQRLEDLLRSSSWGFLRPQWGCTLRVSLLREMAVLSNAHALYRFMNQMPQGEFECAILAGEDVVSKTRKLQQILGERVYFSEDDVTAFRDFVVLRNFFALLCLN